MPKIAEDPTRVPDHIFSGPDLPADEQVRAIFWRVLIPFPSLRGEGGFQGDFGKGSDGTLDYWFE